MCEYQIEDKCVPHHFKTRLKNFSVYKREHRGFDTLQFSGPIGKKDLQVQLEIRVNGKQQHLKVPRSARSMLLALKKS